MRTARRSWCGSRRSLPVISSQHSSSIATSLASSDSSIPMIQMMDWMYKQGFRKVATSRWEFSNDKFKRGEREMLCEIRRRRAWTSKQQRNNAATPAPNQDSDEDQRSSSTSSSSGYTTLVDENKRLKKENGVLTSELTTMKRKCRELLDLVAKYSKAKEKEDKEEEDDDQGGRPMLFGVRLDVEGHRQVKRKRDEIRESASILLSQSCK
ncbi:hypothetical protein PIB30_034921 [Stylosanthes scabra]|uniref:Uncharacterized protein n=1 Tax=Stylosanthes scabra TaxID=79078 RepID=A0ABU6VCA4_9FABA|nr:hypothetical protein [Stylosanthes scabra]